MTVAFTNPKGRHPYIGYQTSPKRTTPQQPANNTGVDGIDRRAIDDLALERDVARTVKEVWDE